MKRIDSNKRDLSGPQPVLFPFITFLRYSFIFFILNIILYFFVQPSHGNAFEYSRPRGHTFFNDNLTDEFIRSRIKKETDHQWVIPGQIKNMSTLPPGSNPFGPAQTMILIPKGGLKLPSKNYDERIIAIRTRWQDGRISLCSGVWIASNLAVTAAHCFCRDGSKVRSVFVSNDVDTTTALDSSTVDKKSLQGSTTLKETLNIWKAEVSFELHPSFDCSFSNINFHDIAVLKTKKQISNISTPKRPLFENSTYSCLNYSMYPEILKLNVILSIPPRYVTIAGFGYIASGTNSGIGKRIKTRAQVNSMSCFGLLWSGLTGCQPLREFVVGAYDPTQTSGDSCEGDSGGPVFVERSNMGFFLIGLVSRGLPVVGTNGQKNICGQGGIYTHVGHKDVRDWLVTHGLSSKGVAVCSNPQDSKP